MTKDDVYRDIEHSAVIDRNGLNIGKVKDFTYDRDEKVLQKFVVKGSNTQVQEWLGIDGKYALLLPHEHIRRQKGNEVFISVPFKDLDTIHNITEDEQRFTIMRSVDVVANDGEDLGRIVDAIFHKDNHFSLVLGGSAFNRFMARLGVTSKNNLFVPYRYIDRFDTNLISLKKNREDLTTMINDILMDSEGYALYEQQKLASPDARMELYNESLKDVLRASSHLKSS